MKRNVILIMSLIFTSVIFGQNISLPELIKLNNYSFDEFDTYVTKKEFKFNKNYTYRGEETTVYAFYVNGKENTFIAKSTENVSVQTPNSSIYIRVKNDLKELGFKYLDKTTDEKGFHLNYEKENIFVSISSSTDSQNRPFYAIYVAK